MSMSLHTGKNQLGAYTASEDNLICRACGTQFDQTSGLQSCFICDDPRQYVPPGGQTFTTLTKLRNEGHRLKFEQDDIDENVTSIKIEPPDVGIPNRGLLIRTAHGNILWDLICYVDEDAVKHINDLGGLSAIIISHPHFYTTWADWSRSFQNIPVYLAAADQDWVARKSGGRTKFLTETHNTILPGVTAIICGGHFPGSMTLHTEAPHTKVPSLFHADTIHTVPNALSPDVATTKKHAKGHTSYTFMWSIPNAIPLDPDQILQIWRVLKGYNIEATYGFVTVRAREGDATIPQRVLESAKILVRRMGYKEHEILNERS